MIIVGGGPGGLALARGLINIPGKVAFVSMSNLNAVVDRS